LCCIILKKAPKRLRTLRFAETDDSGKENKTTDDIEMFMREVSNNQIINY
jgi:hypothetical protein